MGFSSPHPIHARYVGPFREIRDLVCVINGDSLLLTRRQTKAVSKGKRFQVEYFYYYALQQVGGGCFEIFSNHIVQVACNRCCLHRWLILIFSNLFPLSIVIQHRSNSLLFYLMLRPCRKCRKTGLWEGHSLGLDGRIRVCLFCEFPGKIIFVVSI